MRILTIFFFTWLASTVAIKAPAQRLPVSDVIFMNIGDTLPDLTLTNLININESEVHISSLSKPLIILDFWNHGCIACIKAFPKLTELQQKYADKVRIILVNKESKDSTNRFFQKFKNIPLPGLPMVTGDMILHSLFPRDGYPYNVWLDGDLVVKNISSGYNTTAEHIDSFLSNNGFALKNSTKKATYQFALGGNVPEKNGYYSYICPCSDSVNVGHREVAEINEGRQVRLSSNCSSIVDLYIKAFKENNRFLIEPGNVILKVKDSSVYVRTTNPNLYDAWQSKYSYSYDLILPSINSRNAYAVMQQDLERFFSLTVKVIKKKVPIFSLVNSSKPLQQFKNARRNSEAKKPFSEFVIELRQSVNAASYKFYNKAEFSGSVDINVPAKLTKKSLRKLSRELSRYNLGLVREERESLILVLEEKMESDIAPLSIKN